MLSLMDQILQYVRENPGSNGTDIQQQFISTYSKHSISGILGRLQVKGLIENRGHSNRGSSWYPIVFDPVDLNTLDYARWLIKQMKLLPPSERPNFLARHLQHSEDL